ncbi:hypothetical protein G4H71_07810 [Rhodococcus triatomae]|uniref:Excreted virulence factor EspC, type VII ESX diderm n=1 Tax=Rhodococcus triatomae TaxID=300028 RepID=A0A1G8RX54_9NOCA|nr:type VII secretion target [Rhodococcus triatomae]QNG17375.1 hypothetical protein G4H72_00235 [Rhodococcus triatomae]QNG22958.1 hypothetical protein G4H71_07810 [Rhodococcus triatomae]SDJ21531.1 Excreted virulence factor EspC, type VII ESX diderm [Rhodococcus triatomae]
MSFEARPGEIAGLGKQTKSISEDVFSAKRYVDEHTVAFGIFSGTILGALDKPFEIAREAVSKEFNDLGEKTESMAVELNRAAWMYHRTDKQTYDALNAHMADKSFDTSPYGSDAPAPGPAEPYPDPARYALPEDFELKAPDHGSSDIREVIAEAGGWLGDVDTFVKEVSGWSPIETLIQPLNGNWNELKRIGDAYKNAGNAIEACGDSMKSGKSQISDWWKGKAADRYQDYATRQHEALQWWGPSLRVAEKMLTYLSNKLLSGIKELVVWIKDWLEKQVKLESGITGAFKFVIKNTLAGKAAILLKVIYDAKNLLTKIMNGIKDLVEAARDNLPYIFSPSGTYNENFEKTLKPFNEVLKTGKTIRDVKNTADSGPAVNRPKDDFSVGTGNEPWAAAS